MICNKCKAEKNEEDFGFYAHKQTRMVTCKACHVQRTNAMMQSLKARRDVEKLHHVRAVLMDIVGSIDSRDKEAYKRAIERARLEIKLLAQIGGVGMR